MMGFFDEISKLVSSKWVRIAVKSIDNLFGFYREGKDVKREIQKAWADGRITEDEIKAIAEELKDVIDEGKEVAIEVAKEL